MFGLSAEHTTRQYAEHDNPISEVEEHASQDLQWDGSGDFQPTQAKSFRHEVRFDYKYDAKGNWVERVVSIRYEANPDFQRSNIERREISYWPDEE